MVEKRDLLKSAGLGVSGAAVATVTYNNNYESAKVKAQDSNRNSTRTDVIVDGDVKYNRAASPSKEVKMNRNANMEASPSQCITGMFKLYGGDYDGKVRISVHFVYEQDGEVKQAQSGMWDLNFENTDSHNISTKLNYANVNTEKIIVRKMIIIHHSIMSSF